MNEHIKELTLKAGAEDCPTQGVLSLHGEESITKFAELIVLECYAQCKEQLLPKGIAESGNLTYNDGVMDCAIGILSHFGVEQ